MRDAKQITLAGKELTVRELTVVQVTTVMKQLDDGIYTGHILDALVNRDFPANALFMALDMEEGEFDLDIPPSQLTELYDAVIEVNPSCAAMMARLRKVGTRLMGSDD